MGAKKLTVHRWIARDGQSAVSRSLGLSTSQVHRYYHGLHPLDEGLVQRAGEVLGTRHDLAGTLLEWWRVRRERDVVALADDGGSQ